MEPEIDPQSNDLEAEVLIEQEIYAYQSDSEHEEPIESAMAQLNQSFGAMEMDTSDGFQSNDRAMIDAGLPNDAEPRFDLPELPSRDHLLGDDLELPRFPKVSTAKLQY